MPLMNKLLHRPLKKKVLFSKLLSRTDFALRLWKMNFIIVKRENLNFVLKSINKYYTSTYIHICSMSKDKKGKQ